MALTMHTHRDAGIVTEYMIIGGGPERTAQIQVLTSVLRSMTPMGTTTHSTDRARSAMAAISLQLAALLADGNDDNDGSRVRKNARDALHAIRFYLLHRRKAVMKEQKVDAAEAGRRVVEGYAYFDYPWDDLTGEINV